jgi:hypothetical protein
MSTKEDIFDDMALALESWTRTATKAVTDPGASLDWTDNEESFLKIKSALSMCGVDARTVERVFGECFRGLAVSFLTMLDGGTASASKGRVYLVDARGNRLGEGLHDGFVSYLIKTRRMR